MSSNIQAIRDTVRYACQNPQESIHTLSNKTCELFSRNKLTLGTLAATALTCYYSPRTITQLPKALQPYSREVLLAAGTLISGTTKAIQTRNTQPAAEEERVEGVQDNAQVDEGQHVEEEEVDFEFDLGPDQAVTEARVDEQPDVVAEQQERNNQPFAIELGSAQEESVEMPPQQPGQPAPRTPDQQPVQTTTTPINPTVAPKESKPFMDRISEKVSFKKEDSAWIKVLKAFPLIIFIVVSAFKDVVTAIGSYIKGIFTPKNQASQ